MQGQVKSRRRLRVLVVDDDARVRGALRHLLDDVTDLECLAVESDQALRLVTWGSTVPDVAVVDMPSASEGDTLLIEGLAGLLPVVVVSMSGRARGAAAAAGAAGFVEKDGDVAALVDAVRAAACEGARRLARASGQGQNDTRDE